MHGTKRESINSAQLKPKQKTNLVLEEVLNDLVLLNSEGVEVDLLEVLDLAVLDETTKLGAGNPGSLITSATTTAGTTTVTTTTITTASGITALTATTTVTTATTTTSTKTTSTALGTSASVGHMSKT